MEEKQIARNEPAGNQQVPQSGIQRLSEIDFQELFGFEEREITLDGSEAWYLKGRVMPFGNGSRRLAMAMGVEFLMPENIMIDGVKHSNPYIVWDKGRAVGIYILKHGIAIAKDGIRYLQPNLDYVDLTAIVAAMAMNTMDEVTEKSADAAKNCTRTVFNQMKANWKKPGDPDWFFIPTLDDETGIAFNQSEKGEAGESIRKLQGDIIMMKRNPLRKLQTATDRLVFQKLFPEAITSHDSGSLILMDKFGNTKSDAKYLKNVKSVSFKVSVPTKSPIARSMLIEFGIALRDNDAEARERKFGELMRVMGGSIPMKSIASGPIQAEEILEEHQQPIEIAESLKLNPCPAAPTGKEFKEYWGTEFRKLNPEQKNKLLELSGFTEWIGDNGFKITKSNFQALVGYFQELAGIAPPTPKPAPLPDAMRKEMLDYLAEREGESAMLAAIFAKYNMDLDNDFGLIPDETIAKIHKDFITELQNQKGVPTQNATNQTPNQ